MGLEPWSISVIILRGWLAMICETDRDHKIIDPGRRRRNGVDDGTRTHDDRDHNPGLYQLSYAHHRFSSISRLIVPPRGEKPLLQCQYDWRARQDSNLQPSA